MSDRHLPLGLCNAKSFGHGEMSFTVVIVAMHLDVITSGTIVDEAALSRMSICYDHDMYQVAHGMMLQHRVVDRVGSAHGQHKLPTTPR